MVAFGEGVNRFLGAPARGLRSEVGGGGRSRAAGRGRLCPAGKLRRARLPPCSAMAGGERRPRPPAARGRRGSGSVTVVRRLSERAAWVLMFPLLPLQRIKELEERIEGQKRQIKELEEKVTDTRVWGLVLSPGCAESSCVAVGAPWGGGAGQRGAVPGPRPWPRRATSQGPRPVSRGLISPL